MESIDINDLLSVARNHFISGKYQKAEPILHQVLLKSNKLPEVFQMLATIYYDRGLFNKAIATFKRALEIDPTYTDASIGLSIILNDLGRYEEGAKIFNQAKELKEKEDQEIDPFLEKQIAEKHLELAELYFQCRSFKEAMDQFFKALALSAQKPSITLRIVECYLELQQSNKAIKLLKKLIQDYSQYLPARLKLGIIYYSANNIADAVEQWENILLRDPDHKDAKKYLRLANEASLTSLHNG